MTRFPWTDGRYFMHRLILATCCLALVFAAGCRHRPDPANDENAGEGKSAADLEAEQLLNNVIGLLTSNVDAASYHAAVSQLNKFLERRPGEVATIDPAARDRVRQVLGSAVVPQVERKTFAADDIEYLRNSFFLRSVARRLATGQGTPVERASRIFGRVMEQLSLVPTGWDQPGAPADALVRGYGDPQDRMWIFLEILRQSDLFGVVVGVTTKDQPTSIVSWLAGVVDGEEIYLFDPIAGRAMPAPEGSTSPILTLKQLAAEPKLAGFDEPGRTPAGLTVDAIDRWGVLLAIEAPMFAPRMAFVESKLLGDQKVDLAVDLDHWVRTTNQALAPIEGNLGVQVWRYPQEAASGPAPWERSEKASYLRWLTEREMGRRLTLIGDPEEAVRILVASDLRPADSIIYELGLERLNIPLDERRRTMVQLQHPILFFTGLAQRVRQPDDLSTASDWFERYVARGLERKLTRRDAIEIIRFSRQLAGGEGAIRRPLAKQIFDRLSDSSKELLQKAAASEEKAEIKDNTLPEAPPTISLPSPISSAEVEAILAEINEQLERLDLIDPALIEETLDGKTSPMLQVLLDKGPSTDRPEVMRWMNRVAFDLALEESVMPAAHPWLCGAISNWADCLVAQGKADDAVARLTADYPTLAPIQLSSLRARAAYIKD